MIENKGSIYHGIREVKLRHCKGKSIIFDGTVVSRIKGGDSSGLDMHQVKQESQNFRKVVIQLDIETESMIRVRFNEGNHVLDHVTPMVINVYDEIMEFKIEESTHQYKIFTPRYRIEVDRNPYELRIFDRSGKYKFGASTGESNPFLPLDAYSLGLVQGGGKAPVSYFPSGDDLEQETGSHDNFVAVESFDLESDEHIYGFGESFTGLDKRYQRIDLWTRDALGPVSARMYKPIPFFISSIASKSASFSNSM